MVILRRRKAAGDVDLARDLPLALLAGLAGTAAMTLGQKVEQAFTQREDSRTPAKGVERATGVEPEDDASEARLSNATHWTYGTALGAGLLALRGLDEPARTGAFLAGVWGLALALESFANPDEPATEWSAQALATDFGHHLVYAGAATLGYGLLRRGAGRHD